MESYIYMHLYAGCQERGFYGNSTFSYFDGKNAKRKGGVEWLAREREGREDNKHSAE